MANKMEDAHTLQMCHNYTVRDIPCPISSIYSICVMHYALNNNNSNTDIYWKWNAALKRGTIISWATAVWLGVRLLTYNSLKAVERESKNARKKQWLRQREGAAWCLHSSSLSSPDLPIVVQMWVVLSQTAHNVQREREKESCLHQYCHMQA